MYVLCVVVLYLLNSIQTPSFSFNIFVGFMTILLLFAVFISTALLEVLFVIFILPADILPSPPLPLPSQNLYLLIACFGSSELVPLPPCVL